jgi:hypothetical protein
VAEPFVEIDAVEAPFGHLLRQNPKAMMRGRLSSANVVQPDVCVNNGQSQSDGGESCTRSS